MKVNIKMQQNQNGTRNKRYWIFLRGLARGRGHWGDFQEYFFKYNPNDEIEMIDIPGNGERNLVQSPMEISDYVNDIRQQSDFLKQGHSVHILAISLGGMITAEWLRMYPDDIEKAYLCCTSAKNYSKIYERIRPQNIDEVIRLLLQKDDHAENEKSILKMIANNHDRVEQLSPMLIDYSVQYPISRINVIRQLWAASRYKFPATVRGQVVLLGAYGDRFVSPQCTLNIGKAWGVTPIMHPWSGHDLPIDDPDWLASQLKA